MPFQIDLCAEVTAVIVMGRVLCTRLVKAVTMYGARVAL